MARGNGSAVSDPPSADAAVPDADQRREQILHAAATVIGQRGFGETRVTDVAQAAGVSPGLVIYYFGTRDRLLTEALRYSEDQFYAAMAARLGGLGTPTEQLAELVTLSCAEEGLEGSPASWVLWFDLWSQAARNPEVARDREQLDQRWRDAIADIVRAGQRAGEFATGVDPERFSLLLSAVLDGLAVQVALGDPRVRPAVARATALSLASSQLGCSFPPREPPARRRR